MTKMMGLLLIIVTICACKNRDQEAERVFMELWEVFDRNYAFFELRGVDWNLEKEDFLNTCKSIESETALFEEICRLLKKFDDTHINLSSDRLNLYCNAGKTPVFLNEFPSNESFELFLKARNNTLKRIGIDTLSNTESKIFQHGASINQEWGYLRIKRFYGADLNTIKLELDEIYQVVNQTNNLILDVRVNPGGNDETALLCAGYFFNDQMVAFIKTTRNGSEHENFSPPDTTYIQPNLKVRAQHENIFLLTNGASGSSADVFALVMSYLPKVTIIGKNTEGIFSDMHRDTLSNGWSFTLSNERYYSKDMICYEKIGVPVDEVVENRMKEVHKGVDLVIQRVIERVEDAATY